MRYLIEVSPEKIEQVKTTLKALGVKPLRQILNYISVDIPSELVPKIETIEGVVRVVEEKTYKIQIFQMIIPVEKKLEQFLKLGGPWNPLALAWSASPQFVMKNRWTTSESRKVLGADTADKINISGRNVKIAVIDTGFDWTPMRFTVDYMDSTLEGDPIPIDSNGHGTHVITTISGSKVPTLWGFNEGVAKGVKIASIKALGYGIGTARTVDVMEALISAYNWGAKIVNMSLGADIKPKEDHNPETCPICSLVKMLSDRGMLIAVAAGNSGEGYASCPGASPGAITVAALNKNLTVADFSSRRHSVYLRLKKPDVAAPGVYIGAGATGLIAAMEWYDGFKTAYISGTSMATPHVSGLLALWVEYARNKGVELNRETVMDIISHYSSWSEDIGYGAPRFEWIVDYLR